MEGAHTIIVLVRDERHRYVRREEGGWWLFTTERRTEATDEEVAHAVLAAVLEPDPYALSR